MWTFGDGEFGKLGLGHAISKPVPQLVESMCNIGLKKVACGTYITVFLTKDGKVYVSGLERFPWSIPQERSTNKPQQLTVDKYIIEDIAVGTEHVLMLSKCGKVFGWGKNSDEQLGSAHANIIKVPELIKQLIGKGDISGFVHFALFLTCFPLFHQT